MMMEQEGEPWLRIENGLPAQKWKRHWSLKGRLRDEGVHKS